MTASKILYCMPEKANWHRPRNDCEPVPDRETQPQHGARLQGEDFIRSVLKQTLQALAALHARNITHRDVKPENLLLRSAEANDADADGVPEPPPALLVAEPAGPPPPPPSAGAHATSPFSCSCDDRRACQLVCSGAKSE